MAVFWVYGVTLRLTLPYLLSREDEPWSALVRSVWRKWICHAFSLRLSMLRQDAALDVQRCPRGCCAMHCLQS